MKQQLVTLVLNNPWVAILGLLLVGSVFMYFVLGSLFGAVLYFFAGLAWAWLEMTHQ